MKYKKTRKAFSLILCLSLVFGAFGCAKAKNPEGNGSNRFPVFQGGFHPVLRIDETVVNNEWQTPILKAVR